VAEQSDSDNASRPGASIGSTVQVSCITKHGGMRGPYDRIRYLGGHIGNRRWKLPYDDVIRHILVPFDKRRWHFCVRIDQQLVPLVVVDWKDRKYIKAESDVDVPQSLLQLPECP
jgi:hypothetical protein